MGRKLFVVLIDDRHPTFPETIAQMERANAIVRPLKGVNDVINELRAIKQSGKGIVDLILCDVNLEKDDTSDFFELRCQEPSIVKPSYAINGLSEEVPNANDWGWQPDEILNSKLYGPILALPFTRFFRNGGVIKPISTYWQHPKLIDHNSKFRLADGTFAKFFNGYVYIALKLIWAQTDVALDEKAADKAIELGGLDHAFGEKFSEIYNSAVSEPPSAIVERQFYDGITARRLQLYDDALLLPDLRNVTIEKINTGGEVTIWDSALRKDTIDLQSLYADIHRLIKSKTQANLSVQSGDTGTIEELRPLITAEWNTYKGKSISTDYIYWFCWYFIDAYDDNGDGAPTFQMLSRAAFDETKRPNDVDVAFADDPRLLPTRIRRYLLLFSQLYSLSARVSVQDIPMEDDAGDQLRRLTALKKENDQLKNALIQVSSDPTILKKQQMKKLIKALSQQTQQKVGSQGKERKKKQRPRPSVREEISRILGLYKAKAYLDHVLPEFIYAIRLQENNRPKISQMVQEDKFLQPFRKDSKVGWHDYNIIDPKPMQKGVGVGDSDWEWTDLDLEMAQRFWKELGLPENSLPHGLGRRLTSS